MGACCSKINNPPKPVKDVVIINQIEKKNQFVYLQPKGKLYCLRYLDFNVLFLDIELEGWNSAQVRPWPDVKETLDSGTFFEQVHR